MREVKKKSNVDDAMHDFVAGGGDKEITKSRKKAVTVNRRNVTRTEEDDKKLDELVDSALDFKDESGKRYKLNGSEASSLAVDAALYLMKNNPDQFAELLKWTKENRIPN